jgi:hypothetical protein
MKPLNIDKTGCSNISSNCVVWQGPDIECINLCKGDSVTEVVYKLALELCNLMTTLDIKNYDLKCFSAGVCQPQTFQDFINILITKICALQDCNPNCFDSCNPCPTPVTTTMMAAASGTADQTYVPIAKEFQYTSPTGDLVTVMTASDYAQAIGYKVSSLINSTNIIQDTLTSHSKRLAVLEDPANAPTFEMPTVTPVGVLPKIATSMQLVLSATEQQFTELKNAVGDQNNILSNIQKLDFNINDAKSLSRPGTNVSSLRGFNSQPATFADVFGNMLVVLGDMRTALNNIMTNYMPNDCDAISLELTASYRSNQLVIYVQGTLPASYFSNTSVNGTAFTITDSNGNSATYNINIFTIINDPVGYSIDISGTRLNASSNLVITANPSFIHTSTKSMCKSTLQFTLVNIATCPSILCTPLLNEIGFTFNTNSGMQAYTVKLYDSAGVNLITSQTFVSNVIQGIVGKFEKLQSRTLYKVRVEIAINGVTTPCEFTNITTL